MLMIEARVGGAAEEEDGWGGGGGRVILMASMRGVRRSRFLK